MYDDLFTCVFGLHLKDSVVTATGETLTGAALIDHRRQTHSAAGKKWAADAEAVLKDLQVSVKYTLIVVADALL